MDSSNKAIEWAIAKPNPGKTSDRYLELTSAANGDRCRWIQDCLLL